MTELISHSPHSSPRSPPPPDMLASTRRRKSPAAVLGVAPPPPPPLPAACRGSWPALKPPDTALRGSWPAAAALTHPPGAHPGAHPGSHPCAHPLLPPCQPLRLPTVTPANRYACQPLRLPAVTPANRYAASGSAGGDRVVSGGSRRSSHHVGRAQAATASCRAIQANRVVSGDSGGRVVSGDSGGRVGRLRDRRVASGPLTLVSSSVASIAPPAAAGRPAPSSLIRPDSNTR